MQISPRSPNSFILQQLRGGKTAKGGKTVPCASLGSFCMGFPSDQRSAAFWDTCLMARGGVHWVTDTLPHDSGMGWRIIHQKDSEL